MGIGTLRFPTSNLSILGTAKQDAASYPSTEAVGPRSIFFVQGDLKYKVVVSKIFHFHPYLGKESILTNNIFQMGWNHQPEYFEGMFFWLLSALRGCFKPKLTVRIWK